MRVVPPNHRSPSIRVKFELLSPRKIPWIISALFLLLAIGCAEDNRPGPQVQEPVLVCDPCSLFFNSDLLSQRVTINITEEAVNWTVTENRDWLSVFPGAGDTGYEHNEFRVTVNQTKLDAGEYTGEVTLVDESFSSVAVPVTMTVASGHDNQPGELATIPAGRFLMGDGESMCGVTQRIVSLSEDFRLGRYEVTNAEYAQLLQWAFDAAEPRLVLIDSTTATVLDSTGLFEPLLYMGDPDCEIYCEDGEFVVLAGKEEYPVVEVTWYGAACYCDWMSIHEGLPPAYNHETWQCNEGDPYRASGYRLPTDAEWEYATQIEGVRAYPWGDEPPICELANYIGCGNGTHRVGTHAPSPTRYALYDMAGNVREWCHDWFVCDLGAVEAEDPVINVGAPRWRRVLHGGAWSYDLHHLNCAYRYSFDPAYTSASIGFRIAQTVVP